MILDTGKDAGAGDTQHRTLLSLRSSLGLEGKTQLPYHCGVSAREPALKETKVGITHSLTHIPERRAQHTLQSSRAATMSQVKWDIARRRCTLGDTHTTPLFPLL